MPSFKSIIGSEASMRIRNCQGRRRSTLRPQTILVLVVAALCLHTCANAQSYTANGLKQGRTGGANSDSTAPLRETDCACQPSVYTLVVNLTQTCRDTDVSPANNPGITNAACVESGTGRDNNLEDGEIGGKNNMDNLFVREEPGQVSSLELLEFEITRITIWERNANGQTLKSQSYTDGPYMTGDTIIFASSIMEVATTLDVSNDLIPHSLVVTLFGQTTQMVPPQLVTNFWNIVFTNSCDIYPVIEQGQKIGWTSFGPLAPPPRTFCPAAGIPSAKPTNSPSSQAPTERPSSRPTRSPSTSPTRRPSKRPSRQPTRAPVAEPTLRPTRAPNQKPTSLPTRNVPTCPPTPKKHHSNSGKHHEGNSRKERDLAESNNTPDSGRHLPYATSHPTPLCPDSDDGIYQHPTSSIPIKSILGRGRSVPP